jgi:AraC-like DNA-binding protein
MATGRLHPQHSEPAVGDSGEPERRHFRSSPQLEAELTQQRAQKTLTEQVKSILKTSRWPAANSAGCLARIALEHSDPAAPPNCGACEIPAVDGRSATRTRATLSTASSLELNETAYLLGYEDANSFFRAVHQWEGTSPGGWRAVHAHRASSNHASASVA